MEILPELVDEMVKYCSISKENLKKLLELCTKDFCFGFNEEFYKQIDGVAMGTPIAPFVSEYFLRKYDGKLGKLKGISMFRRYVDDCFLVVKKDSIDSIFTDVNSLHPNLKFTSEFEMNGELHFMDLRLIRINNGIETTIYKKPASPTCTTHFTSCHPIRYKRNIIKNMIFRAKKLCSTKEYFRARVSEIKSILVSSGYPLRFVEKNVQNCIPDSPKRQEIDNNLQRNYYGLTYTGAATDRTIKKIKDVWKKNAPASQKLITFNKKAPNLLNKFSKNYKSRSPSSSNVVYRIPCGGCDKSYIGQTGRKLAVRIKEHESAVKNDSKNSAIADHSRNTSHSINFAQHSIIRHESNEFKRKVAEALVMSSHSLMEGNTKSYTTLLE